MTKRLKECINLADPILKLILISIASFICVFLIWFNLAETIGKVKYHENPNSDSLSKPVKKYAIRFSSIVAITVVIPAFIIKLITLL